MKEAVLLISLLLQLVVYPDERIAAYEAIKEAVDETKDCAQESWLVA